MFLLSLFYKFNAFNNLVNFPKNKTLSNVCVCARVHVYVVYEDPNLYNGIGLTSVLLCEVDLWGYLGV